MRVGRNPLTNAVLEGREPVVACVITHMPNDWEQYHLHRHKVIALSIRSLMAHAGIPVHLAIWDNGSHKGFTNWLKDDLKPDTLVLSRNVGKSVARKALFGMFHPQTIMAVADDDMYYFPNWLVPQLELLQHFPNVGTVTGYPVKTSFRWANKRVMEWAEDNAEIETGEFIKPEWDEDFCTSIGREYHHHKKINGNVPEYKVTWEGKEALAVGHHCQFVCVNGMIAPLLKWDVGAMADEKPFDKAVDEKHMRLCTTERYTRHMGNALDDKLMGLARSHNLSVSIGNDDKTSKHPSGIETKAGGDALAAEASPLPVSLT